jgi:hypothetical protein
VRWRVGCYGEGAGDREEVRTSFEVELAILLSKSRIIKVSFHQAPSSSTFPAHIHPPHLPAIFPRTLRDLRNRLFLDHLRQIRPGLCGGCERGCGECDGACGFCGGQLPCPKEILWVSTRFNYGASCLEKTDRVSIEADARLNILFAPIGPIFRLNSCSPIFKYELISNHKNYFKHLVLLSEQLNI